MTRALVEHVSLDQLHELRDNNYMKIVSISSRSIIILIKIEGGVTHARKNWRYRKK